MKSMVNDFKSSLKNNYKIIIFCFLCSFITLLFCSKSSFIYPFNDTYDVNAYFTVGKSWVNGLIPYKDLFDHKGPFVYIVYGLASLISYRSYLGVFILEVLFFTVFLFYISKIINIFLPKRYSYFIIPFFAVLICSIPTFVVGGTVEEFCLPFVAYTFYYLLIYFKGKELSKKDFFKNGLVAGIIFMTKFNFLAFWFGFMFFIMIDLIIQKKYKEAITDAGVFLIGMFTPFLVFIIYFALNHALKDFFYVYFYANIFGYNASSKSILTSITNTYTNFIGSLLNNTLVVFLLFMASFGFIRTSKLNKKYKIMLTMIILIFVYGIFMGDLAYFYYLTILLPIMILGVIGLCLYFKDYIDKIIYKKYSYVLFIMLYILFSFMAFKCSNAKEDMFKSQKDTLQYKYSQIINKDDDKSLLNIGLDYGMYFMTGTIPNYKYFASMNFNPSKFPDNYIAQKQYIERGQPKYIVTADNHNFDDLILKKYELVSENYKNAHQSYALYKRKD